MTIFQGTFWDQTADNFETHPDSDEMRDRLMYAVYEDGSSFAATSYGVVVVDTDDYSPLPQRTVMIRNEASTTRRLQREVMAVPLPADIKPPRGTDGHVTVIDRANDKIYDFWKFRVELDGTFSAKKAAVLHEVSSSGGMFRRWPNHPGTSAIERSTDGVRGSGLPLIGGVATVEEAVSSGQIPHLMAMILPHSVIDRVAPVSPATRCDGGSGAHPPLCEGQRGRLVAGTEAECRNSDGPFTELELMLIEAVEKYGFMVVDGGSHVAFVGETYRGQDHVNPWRDLFKTDQATTAIQNFPWDRVEFVF